ncbi:MAG: alpha/beta fold hydrolase [Elusimicrobiaceae bacterium]|nr:alpha/beta fold hydrolase [Elusimicrobiaceae bacterium]
MKKIIFLFVATGLLGLGGCTTIPSQPDFTIQGDHGKLAAVLHTPANKKAYPLVLIVHGFNASKEMDLLVELSKQLNARGIATLRFDFNGHGASEGSFLDMTIPNELEDARRVYKYARRLPGVTSVSAVGHSQGGVIVGMLAGELGEKNLRSIALMSPAPELKEDTARGDLFGVKYNPQNPPEYITLSNGLKVGRAFLETTPHVPIYEVSSKYTGPVLVVHSKDDQLVPYRYGAEYSRVFTQARLKTLHGFNHNFTQDITAVDKIVADFFDEQLNK